MKKIVLHGGGNSAFDMFENFEQYGILDKASVAYVPIAFEYFEDIKQEIKDDFEIYANKLFELGAKSACLVYTDNFDKMFECDTIILGGGVTDFLLEKLRVHDFAHKLSKSKVKYVAGSSAGAIALCRKGLGFRGGKEYVYYGLGVLDEFVVVHSDDEMKRKYPDAMHLDDDESKVFEV